MARPRQPSTPEQQDARRAADAGRKREARQAGRDAGVHAPPAHPRRKTRCRRRLLDFCRTYLADRFPLPFSPDHLTVIARLQVCVMLGGQYALAMPRGSGKTTLCEAACLWAILYGHRRFVVLIGASDAHALEMMESVKIAIETNDLIHEDFAEVTHYVRALDRIAHRAKGQLSDGKPTHIGWSADQIAMPCVEGSAASGAVLVTTGITGRIRGMKHATPDGASIRPDLVIVDDPQTDESAASPAQNQKRERVLAGAVLGLGGPRTKIAAVMPCTVIEPGDMADRILDRQRHPEWNGERYRLVYEMPSDVRLWEEYDRIRREGLRAGEGLAPATAFYRANRDRLDAGARVAWQERYNPDEASAIQHAMNLRLADERSFMAEYQNEPLSPRGESEIAELSADQIAGKLSRIPHRETPAEATRLTAMIDVQGQILYYAVCAWSEGFGGQVIDYGTWPRQQRAYYRAADAMPSLSTVYPGYATDAAIYAGLRDLCSDMLGRSYLRHGGEDGLRIERCLIDANWGESTEAVYQFCRQATHAAILLPSHGRGIGAAGKPLDQWRPGNGDRAGLNWRVMAPAPPRKQRHVIYDTNWWKSFVAARWAAPPGGPGCLSLWGERASDHQLFADHLTAEFRVRTEGRGRVVEEWRLRPERPDNHWLDCVVGCAVGASERGLHWSAAGAAGETDSTPAPKRIKFSDLQKQKRQAREGR